MAKRGCDDEPTSVPCAASGGHLPDWGGVGARAPALGASGQGSMIVFERVGPDGAVDLWSMNGTGEDQTIFLSDAADVDFSPSGKHIAFDRAAVGEAPDIYISRGDGTGLRRLTEAPGLDVRPDWSPDGRSITFTSDRDGKPDIYVISPDGGPVQRLTDDALGAQGSVYSPNGRQIAFTTFGSGLPRIAVMDADGGDPVVLTDGPDLEPSWSPDGRQIAFISVRDGTREVYVMAADGSGQTRLTTDLNRDIGPPMFDPSGRELAFMSQRAGNFDVYALSLRTREERRLTTDSAVDGFPEWRQGSAASH